MMGARHLRGYGELERVRPGSLTLTAVCDPDAARAEAVACEAGELLGRRPACFTDLGAALADGGAGAADVVTPNRTHDAVAIEALESGLHVLLEKPFAVTVARGRRILAAERRTGRILATAENNRRDPMNRLAKAVVQHGLIGAVNHLHAVHITRGGRVIATPWRHRLAMGGIPMDVWVHMGYVVESIAGPVDWVAACGGMVESARSWKQADGSPAKAECDSPDHISASLGLCSGATGVWCSHFASPSASRFERLLIGSDGVLACPPDRSGKPVRVELREGTVEGEALVEALPDWRLSALETALFGERPASYRFEPPVTDRKLIAAEVGDFVDSIREGRAAEATGETGLRSVAVILSLLESMHAGRRVRVAEVLDGSIHAVQDMIEEAG